MLKFNDNNIYVGQIKQLLKDFNLPRCQIYKDEMNTLYDSNIIYIKDKNLYRGDKIISSYKIDDKIMNITDNLDITSNIYDSTTHKYLGDYLRFIRDYTGLDLMQMYNCFTNESPVNIDIEETLNNELLEELKKFNTNQTKYKVFVLPIKYNKKYTIGIDCSAQLLLRPCFYEHKDLIENDITTEVSKRFKTTSVSGTQFRHPFIYESPKAQSSEELLQEDTLKLLIRLPITCNSSVVVLEGDYTRGCDLYLKKDNKDGTTTQVLASTESEHDESSLIEYKHDNKLYKINYFISKPQLLYINSGENNLLADRLLEYLSRCVIDSNEEITDNIKMVQKEIQKEISTDEFKHRYNDDVSYKAIYPGIWDNSIRTSLYNYVYKSNKTANKDLIINTYFDMLGYYDKDVEQALYEYDEQEAKSFEL